MVENLSREVYILGGEGEVVTAGVGLDVVPFRFWLSGVSPWEAAL
jgi:hypothetical protein